MATGLVGSCREERLRTEVSRRKASVCVGLFTGVVLLECDEVGEGVVCFVSLLQQLLVELFDFLLAVRYLPLLGHETLRKVKVPVNLAALL